MCILHSALQIDYISTLVPSALSPLQNPGLGSTATPLWLDAISASCLNGWVHLSLLRDSSYDSELYYEPSSRDGGGCTFALFGVSLRFTYIDTDRAQIEHGDKLYSRSKDSGQLPKIHWVVFY